MNGSNLSSAATGLMQGIQFMDNRKRVKAQDERQLKLDAQNEQEAARRAEVQGLALKMKQDEYGDYQANAGLRESERATKTKAAADQQEHDLFMDGYARALAQDQATGKVDGRLSVLAEAGKAHGLTMTSSAVDPKTGAITVGYNDAEGKPQTHVYKDTDDMDDNILLFGSSIAAKGVIAGRAANKAADAEATRKQQGLLEIEKEKNAGAQKVAKITASSRVEAARLTAEGRKAVAAAQASIKADGNGSNQSKADIKKNITTTLNILKDDNSLKYNVGADGKPDYSNPRSFGDKYKAVAVLLYGPDWQTLGGGGAASGVSLPASTESDDDVLGLGYE